MGVNRTRIIGGLSTSVVRSYLRRLQLLLPDVVVTRHVNDLGRVAFHLRRQHEFLWEDFWTNRGAHLRRFGSLVREGDVVYDIGANTGYFMRHLVRNCSVHLVVCFEPVQDNVRVLRRNISLGEAEDRVVVLPVAVGEASGRQRLQIDDVKAGSSVLDSISAGRPSAARQSFRMAAKTAEVDVVSLDDAVVLHDLPAPDVIKIDVEGAEAMVLAGMSNVLQNEPLLNVAIHTAAAADDVTSRLDAQGYELWEFRGGEFRRYERRSFDCNSRNIGVELVAARPTHLERITSLTGTS